MLAVDSTLPHLSILGDPGADSGGERKSKRAGKYGTKKSKERREEPLGTMSYQTSSKRSLPFCLLIGQKNTNVFWHQSEARTIPTVWNWSGKTLSPGALLAVFHFLSPHYLPLGLRGWFKRCKLRERVARNGHHDYGIGSGAGAVENAVDLSTAFFPLLS